MKKYQKDYSLIFKLDSIQTEADVNRINNLHGRYHASINVYNRMLIRYSGYMLTKMAKEIGKREKVAKQQLKEIKTIEKEIKQFIKKNKKG